MKFQFTHVQWLFLLPVAWAWVIALALKSDVQTSPWRRWMSLALRLVVILIVVLAIAGLQWMKPQEGVNVFFLLDRSESIPPAQQEAAHKMANRFAENRRKSDKMGLLVFGTDAALESTASAQVDLKDTKILAVIGTERTDIGGAIRLGTAAFPETGQKRLVLFSDGNENMGDALEALSQAQRLGVTIDVVPLAVQRGDDVSIQKLTVPARVKKGQPFEVKIFVQADKAQKATVRLYRNDEPLGAQEVDLTPGKNLFTFPQNLDQAEFYSYAVQVEAPGDRVPQNNQASAFVTVHGDPRVLIVSAEPAQDQNLVDALRSARLDARLTGIEGFPATLGELESYDAIFISNLAAGDIGRDGMRLLESAVRDFGVGLVCVGGDQTYAAGGYRNTPLETTLPVNMELDSKKVLPKGAVALIMHGMEFANGNQRARECAIGVLDALGPTDELGVLLWDGSDHWLFPLTPVGNKKALGEKVAGMNQGDLGSFQGIMQEANDALKKSTANLKHILIFSDGDPAAPNQQLMDEIVKNRITVSTVLISGHSGPDTMQMIADRGRGRFYNVQNASQLPQIFVKEAAVILKSAIFEEPFTPKIAAGSELTKGIGAYPQLQGYVCTTPKDRAETPLLTDKGDPLLAHWQYGLGRAVAWTSDAKARWGKNWLGWGQYRQFWTQTAQWALRRIENADFTTEVSVEKGEGRINVEAVDDKGEYKNFLNLQTVVVSPKGDRVNVRLEQTGPGHYEAKFPTKEVGSYHLNLMEIRDGKLAGSQRVGASVNYSPEFNATEPNLPLLRRLADAGGGKFIELAGGAAAAPTPAENPFLHDRHDTFQPRDWWEWLVRLAIVLFVLDVGLRRIHLEAGQVSKAWAAVKRKVLFWEGVPRPAEADVSLGALLHRRDEVRAKKTAASEERPELFQPASPVVLPEKLRPPTSAGAASDLTQSDPQPPKPQDPAQSTTGRLLDAKRKAQKKRDE
ncbi:MAG: hypothetical protein QOF48_2617 [Verrucomicrobiota bacterium]|jgi:uncharacterized membrane protein